jgi:hypothetical protein
LKSHLGKEFLKNFPNLLKAVEKYDKCSCTYDKFCIEVQNLWQEIERRFQVSKRLGPVLVFMSFPFAEVDSEEMYAAISSMVNINASD